MAEQAARQRRVRHISGEEDAKEQAEARTGRIRTRNAGEFEEEPGEQVGLHNNAGRRTGNGGGRIEFNPPLRHISPFVLAISKDYAKLLDALQT